MPVPFVQGAQSIKLATGGGAIWRNLIPAGLFAAAASLLPGLRAVRLTPSECLREV
jgi:ABC-type lipoprotein release transport system permease subunit